MGEYWWHRIPTTMCDLCVLMRVLEGNREKHRKPIHGWPNTINDAPTPSEENGVFMQD